MRPQRIKRRALHLFIVNALVIALVLTWSHTRQRADFQTAIAKGQRLLDLPAGVSQYPQGYVLDSDAVKQLTLSDPVLQRAIAGTMTEFVSAVPMSAGEAGPWASVGCGRLNCAYVTFYNYSEGGTLEGVLNLETGELLDLQAFPANRPAGSAEVLSKALAVAAADPQVRATLGEAIGAVDPVMIPMSGWMSNGACSIEWCVDLTFHDPQGTGKVFHVFVNMEREEVARIFFSRARPDRSLAKPLEQRNAFTDGCHEQYGWSICWEMTAHDGIDFRDAAFNGSSVFSSAKLGQIEAWYPSWPGGYRDEIGFAGTVPPFGDTVINDLGDGFEIQQTFTEFTRWPNCICCYRYEQIVRLFGDGRFEFRFVSHGPGCEDLSIYRPFWRIDLALDGQGADDVWLFEETQWSEQPVEFESHPVVENLSPEGHKVATYDGDVHYRWRQERSDPLGLDEGYLFLLNSKAGEGDGPITTGPGDTFIPPRQWLDGDPLSGEDIVLWWVPILSTKQGGPWWCQPDPEPEFSPCDVTLRADPAGEIRQPSPEELATLQVESAFTPSPAPPTLSPDPTATLRPIAGNQAEEVILNAGCGSCHKIGNLGEAHKVGPDLTYIGLTASDRVPDLSAEAYIRQSIVDPNAYLAPECPNAPCMPGIMPQNFGTRLTGEQVDLLVSYLLERQGPEPTPASIGSGLPSRPAPKVSGAAKVSTPTQPGVLSSTAAGVILILIVLVISLVILVKGRT